MEVWDGFNGEFGGVGVIFFIGNPIEKGSGGCTAKSKFVSVQKNTYIRYCRKKNEKKKAVSFYVKQWFKSERRNRKAEILFGLFMTIAIVLCALTDTPKNKLDSNIEYLYKVNMCRLDTNDTSQDMYKELCNIDGIADVVLLYGRNLR